MCEIKGKKYWFDMAPTIKDEVLGEMYLQIFDKEDNEEDFDRVRFYYVYELPDEVVNELVKQHDLFMQYVGCRTDYDQSNTRSIGTEMKPEEEWKKFYDNRESIDVKTHLVRKNRIGWFDSNSIYYYGKENK